MSAYYFSLVSLAFLILVTIAFITRKKNRSAENIIFISLIFADLACVLLELFCIYLSRSYPESTIYKYCFRFYLVFMNYYVLIFTQYIISLAQVEMDVEEKIKKQNKLSNIAMVFLVIWTILISYSDQFTQGASYSTKGFITYLSLGLSSLCLVYCIVKLLFNIKKLNGQKLIPISIIILSGLACCFIQYSFPTLRLLAPAFTFSLVILYFTIFPLENPDIKMVQEMEETKKEADIANQAKTEYLSNISHEIRTPLNAILGFSQSLLEENVKDGIKAEASDIISASENLLDIVNDILDISKIESNKLDIFNVDYSTQELYNSLSNFTEERLEGSGITFTHNFSGTIPHVLYGDVIRIKQIIINFLTNAIKYTNEGSINLDFNCDIVEKDIYKMMISVSDTGRGIKEENIGNVFSKFKGLKLQKDINVDGTGLGLSLCKKLADMMDGKIEVQSKYGEGSTFTLIINQNLSKKTVDELERENSKSLEKGFVGNGQRVLIVDDNEVNIKVALRMMRKFNLQIDTSSSSKDFIATILAGNKYDLIFLDDMMPEMSGVEVLRYLKENSDYNTPTIALTANFVPDMKNKYIRDGFTDYLSKPIDKERLEDLLIRYLGNSTSRVEETPKVIAPTEEKLNRDFLIANGFKLKEALDFLGGIEMYNDTAKDFLGEIEKRLVDLDKYKNENDMANYAILVHSLKSDAKYLGIMDLAELAAKHESASKSNDIDFVNSDYDNLINLTKKKVDIIKRYIG
ncbi:MAG: ATP-binding protein [Bacilli bacterium]|nr:ATP-binding protein [Bacilli bacterium]